MAMEASALEALLRDAFPTADITVDLSLIHI